MKSFIKFLVELKTNYREVEEIEYFRGVDMEDAKKWAKGEKIPTSDNNLMPLDGEVVEYGMGDEYKSASEKKIERWIRNTCDWYKGSISSIRGGLNVTTDFENAEGYGDVVLLLEIDGPLCEFSDSHVFVKNVKDVEVKFLYHVRDRLYYTPAEFLKKYH